MRYFITNVTSETGKKLVDIETRAARARCEAQILKTAFGADSFHTSEHNYKSGIWCLWFAKRPTAKCWDVFNEHRAHPNNSPQGRAIQYLFDRLPVVKWSEINEAVGYAGQIFTANARNTSGELADSRDNFVEGFDHYRHSCGFIIDDADYIPPLDCEEVNRKVYLSVMAIEAWNG